MKKLTLFTAMLMTANMLFAQIIHIPADYPTIQQGINNASNGAIILLQPGTYDERVNFNGKSLTLASLFHTTQDTSYISQTIIWGQGNGDKIILNGCSNARISGITITRKSSEHGRAINCQNSNQITLDNLIIRNLYGKVAAISVSYSEVIMENLNVRNNTYNYYPNQERKGGGLYCAYADIVLKSSVFKGNTADHGGGIYFGYGNNVTIESTLIEANSAEKGGGIFIGQGNNITFDSINRCSVYHNTAVVGNDFYMEFESNPIINLPQPVFLDTASVLFPTGYYALPAHHFAFQNNHGLLNQVYNNIYVSPQGNNDNSGLSPLEPYQTIRHALSVIYVDSLNKHTIHLLPGTHGGWNYFDVIPLPLFDYINIEGSSPEEVIVDRLFSRRAFHAEDCNPVRLSGMTIINGNSEGWWAEDDGGGIYCLNAGIEIENVKLMNNYGVNGGGIYFSNSQGSVKNSFITENSADSGGGIYFYGNNNLTFQNVSIFGNTAVSGGGIYVTTIEVNAVEMWDINEPYEGIIFNESLISYNEAEAGGGIYITGNGNFSLENSTVIGNVASGGGGVYSVEGSPRFCNVVFNENTVNPDSGDGSVMMLDYGSNPELMNVTISGNYQYDSVTKKVYLINGYAESVANITNSIVWGNTDLNKSMLRASSVNIQWSNIQHPENWPGTGNIHSDPLFAGEGTNPYQLSPGSPCIDAGTPDTTGLNLPLMDLLGNHRIWDGNGNGIARIDMGAYEFDSPIYVGIPQSKIVNPKSEIQIFPNPFTTHTTIEFNLPQTSTVSIQIFNAMGAKVAELHHGQLPARQQRFAWDAGDLPKGLYFCRVQVGQETFKQKIIKVQ